MTSQFVGHEAIFLLSARTDVVNDFPVPRCTFLIANEHDVRQLAAHETSDQIPGLKCFGSFGIGRAIPLREKNFCKFGTRR